MDTDDRKRIKPFFFKRMKTHGILKKLMLLGLTLTFFMLSSSFAFPVRMDRGGSVSAGIRTEGEKRAAGLSGQDTVKSGSKALSKEKRTESKAVFTKEDWRLLLINKQHPIPEDYTFELVTIKGSMKCDERILEDLLLMLQDAREDDINLVIRSPYRDMNRQEYLFNRKIKAYMGKGMSYMDAYKTASTTVTVPGASEHQIGLAIDITSDNYASLDEGFGETEAGKWLAEHSCEYGFILRYPDGKEYITSIDYEPWHFRYVGKEAAAIITEQGITLEEFVENYL